MHSGATRHRIEPSIGENRARCRHVRGQDRAPLPSSSAADFKDVREVRSELQRQRDSYRHVAVVGEPYGFVTDAIEEKSRTVEVQQITSQLDYAIDRDVRVRQIAP